MVSNHKFTEWQFILRIKNIFIDELNEHVPVGISTDTVVDSGEGVNSLPLAAPPPSESRDLPPSAPPRESVLPVLLFFGIIAKKVARALRTQRFNCYKCALPY